ncbi:MAG: hypothetical protein ACFB2Z_01220 [Maricaulaceae bacterium]
MRSILGVALAVGLAGTAWAGEFRLSGQAGGELRFFPVAPQFPDQLDDFQPSLRLEAALEWESDDRRWLAVLNPFGRLDARDGERTHADLREAYVQYFGDGWDLTVGLNQVFFGVTESRHLVQIVNQVDFVEEIDEEDFLGEPMIRLSVDRDIGRFQVFVLPGVRLRTFPGESGRFRAPVLIDDDVAEFESPLNRGATDFLFRYSNFFGDFDVGAYVFRGTTREPTIDFGAVDFTVDPPTLTPFFDQITQIGVDVQYTRGAWLWKLEGIFRSGQGPGFGASVFGFEYTFFDIGGRGWDLGLLAEGQYDGRGVGTFPTAADNDLFLGTRFAFNDAADTAILAGSVTDLENGSTGIFVEAERRIAENWFIELESRLFIQVDPTDGAALFQDDDVLQLRLTRFF